MINDKRVIAIIPARAGSKGLPGKNTRDLCGKPLIAWSIEAGLQSKYIDEVMVTTDSRDIADVAQQYGAEVPFLRPGYLADDAAPTFDTVKHVLDTYEEDLNKTFEYVVLLEPTSPLREKSDIDNMIKNLTDEEYYFDSIISVGEVHEHPSIMKKIVDGNRLEQFCSELNMTSRRQDNKPAYFPYGVAYIAKTPILLEQKTFYTERSTFYQIKRYQCYEIDDIYDFLSIESVMKHEWGA